jgi:hypothetical protein
VSSLYILLLLYMYIFRPLTLRWIQVLFLTCYIESIFRVMVLLFPPTISCTSRMFFVMFFFRSSSVLRLEQKFVASPLPRSTVSTNQLLLGTPRSSHLAAGAAPPSVRCVVNWLLRDVSSLPPGDTPPLDRSVTQRRPTPIDAPL